MPIAVLGCERVVVAWLPVNYDPSDFINDFRRAGPQGGIDVLSMDVASHIHYCEDLRRVETVEGHHLQEDMAKVFVAGILVEQFLECLFNDQIFLIEFITCSPHEFRSRSTQCRIHGREDITDRPGLAVSNETGESTKPETSREHYPRLPVRLNRLRHFLPLGQQDFKIRASGVQQVGDALGLFRASEIG
jgi:hypothetical protein